MKFRNGKIIVFLYLIVFCLIVVNSIFFFLNKTSVFILISKGKNYSFFDSRIMSRDENLELQFLHSVAKKIIREIYKVKSVDEGFRLDQIIIEAPFVPAPYEEDLFVPKANEMVAQNINRLIPEIRLRMGGISKHQLWIGDNMIPLFKLIEPGEVIIIQTKKMTFQYFVSTCINLFRNWNK